MQKKSNTAMVTLIGSIVVMIILVFGTVWMGNSARRDTEQAVRSVSLLYLDELAGRRVQVVAGNLQDKVHDMHVALELMSEEDFSDLAHLQAYQSRIKQLFNLDKFAFVDGDGLIYTALGKQDNIGDYAFDYRTLSGPEVSVLNPETGEKKVVIALPAGNIPFEGKELVVCFMEIDMEEMLRGVSIATNNKDITFCNIYTADGAALSNTVLGGLAAEDNLLDALANAEYENGYSYELVRGDFSQGKRGVVSFTYNGIRETLSYVPVEGTSWLLTYLIRESVISDSISGISYGMLLRSVIQSVLTVAALLLMFLLIISQNRRNAQLILERETADAENRARHQELEQRLALQDKLLEQERQREQQSQLITALASDYRSVYFIHLDTDSGVCYQPYQDLKDGLKAGEKFPYLETMTAYAERYVTEPYRAEFLRFIQPDAVRGGLTENRIISFRYIVSRGGKESYEMIRFAGVRHPEDREDGIVHSVGACFTDVDEETRQSLLHNQALRDALDAAEQANKAKTAFLSNMSHEIRTPMNAIIGLDNIALSDPQTPEKTRIYLEQIGTSAEHLLNLINDILDMSRIESGHMTLKNEEFSFSRLLETINTMFSGQCREKGLDYHCQVRGEVSESYIGDTMKLRQVLINILGNAVKFTPRGGSVTLTVEQTAHYEGQSTLRFTVADTGIGMSPEFLPHIFDTFSQEDASATTKYGSSGLGMPITRSLVEMMNGTIEVQSEKGAGSTFIVTVTLTDAGRHEPETDDVEIQPHELSVLVVDDDPIACEHARLVLEKAGIAAEVAASGAEAVEMVKLRQARRAPYNLILMDWQMPEMDGVEATRQIRAVSGDDSAIIILTAYRWDDILEEAVEAGVDSFVSKPLFAAAVLEEFKAAMQRRHTAAQTGTNRADLTGKRILLAEDVEVNAEIMKMVLQMRQIETDLAVNGKAAVECFASHPEGYYDAILMDMRMPEMDGLEATRRIRAMDRKDAKTIPIIALTANAFDEDVQRSLQAGLNAHLSKPVQPEALYETLESLIPA